MKNQIEALISRLEDQRADNRLSYRSAGEDNGPSPEALDAEYDVLDSVIYQLRVAVQG